MRILAFIEYGAIGVGVAAILAGQYLSLPKGMELGLCLIGVGLALAGAEALFTRQMSMRMSDYGWDDWMGTPAVIIGLMQLLLGAVLIGSAYEVNAGRWPVLLDFVATRPGPVLAGLGLLLIGTGLVIIIVADRYGGKLRFVFVGLPRILVGAMLLILGIAVAGAGAWEWVDHSSFKRFAEANAQKFKLPSPSHAWRRSVSLLK